MKKSSLISIILLLSFWVVYGQISTSEEPVSFKSNLPALRTSEKTVKSFALLDMKIIEQEDKEDEANGKPPRFGYRHEVSYDLDNSGEWADLLNGDKIWRLIISCKDALSINLLYDKFWIPEGAKFFVYSNDRKHSIGAFTSKNNFGKRNDIQGFATGLVYGDQVTLEYYLPNAVKEVGVISVAYVVHGYRYIRLPGEEKVGYGDSGDCQVNVNCDEGQDWQYEKDAVAMVLVNGYRVCSGSLVNTTSKDNYYSYFLTANHCLDDYDAVTHNSPNLNHWSFYWNYEAPSCTDALPIIRSTVGARLYANNPVSDFALLGLGGMSDPRNRNDVTLYYLGWDRSGNAGTGGVGIHHPNGDIKKISTYTATPVNSTCRNSNFWDISFASTTNGFSVTEPGSSGSPLLNMSKRIIGQLYGPGTCTALSIPCNNPSLQRVAYGKFSVSWTGNGASDKRRRLNYWLDPAGTNPTNLDGIRYLAFDLDIPSTVYADQYYYNFNITNIRGIVNDFSNFYYFTWYARMVGGWNEIGSEWYNYPQWVYFDYWNMYYYYQNQSRDLEIKCVVENYYTGQRYETVTTVYCPDCNFILETPKSDNNNAIDEEALETEDAEDQVYIYPNPVSNILNINIEDNSNYAVLRIFNSLGVEVQTVSPVNSTNQINVQNLHLGTYTIILSGNGLSKSYKFTKQ